VKNLDILFLHNYDIKGFLSLKLVCKTFNNILNEEKIYKEIFNIKKFLFFVNSYEEYKELQLNQRKKKFNYKLKLLYKIAKVNTWYFPLVLKMVFGGFNNIIKLPVMYNISSAVLDGFSYSNYWTNNYFKMDHPIMRGVDTKGRNFLLIKYYDLTNKREIIEAFFNNTLYDRGGDNYDLRELVSITYFHDEIDYDYWEYNGAYGKTLIGDYFFQTKTKVKQLTDNNYRLIEKLLKNDIVTITSKHFDEDFLCISTLYNGNNFIDITLDRLIYVRKCINGLSSQCLSASEPN